MELQKEIEARRHARLAEDAKLRKEMEEIEMKKQFLAAGAAQVEEKKFRQLEMGAERKLDDRLRRERLEHEAYLQSMQREKKQRTKVVAERQQAKTEFRRRSFVACLLALHLRCVWGPRGRGSCDMVSARRNGHRAGPACQLLEGC